MQPRKFRFAVQTSNAPSADAWEDKARLIEDLGFSTLFIPDHFGDQLSPEIAMMAAADATTTLRVAGLVFDNDYRHPVVFAKQMATIDVLSGGRVEVGIGAGWMQTDYDASGIAYDRPGTRISRLEEALEIIKGAFSDRAVDHQGKHYTITAYDARPKPVQQPHPPILLGGGGKRVLTLAAKEADIVGVNFNLEPGAVNRQVLSTGDAASTEEKIEWIRSAAGERFRDLELNVTVFSAIVTDDRTKMAERIAPGFGMPVEQLLESPHVLIGSAEQMCETLQERRERYGFSYVAFSGDNFEQLAPVVKKLAGT
jgi:probable F420-dependent oxidoreductase